MSEPDYGIYDVATGEKMGGYQANRGVVLRNRYTKEVIDEYPFEEARSGGCVVASLALLGGLATMVYGAVSWLT